MNGWRRLQQGWSRRLKFSDLHPLWFLLVYILAVPVFGAVYASLPPPSFYAPYARYEPSARADANRVAADLYASVKASLASAGTPNPTPGAWWIDPQSIGVSDVTVEADQHLTFTVRFTAWRREPSGGQLMWSLHVSAPMRERSISFEGKTPPIVTRFVSLQGPRSSAALDPLGISDAQFAAALFRAKGVIQLSPGLSLTEAQEQRLQAFARGRQGDPSAISGDIWRMTYFSAITITTVGFGDIVPLTPTARTLAGLEAVLGWVLAGLFLNAAAHRLGRAKKDRSRQELSVPSQ